VGDADSTRKGGPSIKRKRLHVLYLVNDILYHAKYRINDASVCGKTQPILMSLFGSAASFTKCPKHHAKILDLLNLWDEKRYYSKEYLEKLREAVKNASEAGSREEGAPSAQNGDQDLSAKTAKSMPYVMPAQHGDLTTSWFDLPAGNLMPHIVPNSTRPINPDMIKPLQFVAGPADETLVLAVKGLLDDVRKMFGEGEDREEKLSWDIDELGQPIILDEITGEVLEGQGYYGWSRTFCEKMKRRKKGIDVPDREQSQGRQSRSRSGSGTRKRRYSQSSDGSDRDNYRRSRARREYSSSRSRSPSVRGSRSRNRSFSRTPRRSSSPRNQESFLRDRPPSPLKDRPEGLYSQAPAPSQFQRDFKEQYQQPLLQPPFPPPPNMNFNGWVPPPPPMHNAHNAFSSMNYPGQHWPPPPPPGPPPFPAPDVGLNQHSGAYPPSGWPQQQQGDGRGYNNGWNNAASGPGRGGRGNYRGRGW
jgi:hypothetical protein